MAALAHVLIAATYVATEYLLAIEATCDRHHANFPEHVGTAVGSTGAAGTVFADPIRVSLPHLQKCR